MQELLAELGIEDNAPFSKVITKEKRLPDGTIYSNKKTNNLVTGNQVAVINIGDTIETILAQTDTIYSQLVAHNKFVLEGNIFGLLVQQLAKHPEALEQLLHALPSPHFANGCRVSHFLVGDKAPAAMLMEAKQIKLAKQVAAAAPRLHESYVISCLGINDLEAATAALDKLAAEPSNALLKTAIEESRHCRDQDKGALKKLIAKIILLQRPIETKFDIKSNVILRQLYDAGLAECGLRYAYKHDQSKRYQVELDYLCLQFAQPAMVVQRLKKYAKGLTLPQGYFQTVLGFAKNQPGNEHYQAIFNLLLSPSLSNSGLRQQESFTAEKSPGLQLIQAGFVTCGIDACRRQTKPDPQRMIHTLLAAGHPVAALDQLKSVIAAQHPESFPANFVRDALHYGKIHSVNVAHYETFLHYLLYGDNEAKYTPSRIAGYRNQALKNIERDCATIGMSKLASKLFHAIHAGNAAEHLNFTRFTILNRCTGLAKEFLQRYTQPIPLPLLAAILACVEQAPHMARHFRHYLSNLVVDNKLNIENKESQSLEYLPTKLLTLGYPRISLNSLRCFKAPIWAYFDEAIKRPDPTLAKQTLDHFAQVYPKLDMPTMSFLLLLKHAKANPDKRAQYERIIDKLICKYCQTGMRLAEDKIAHRLPSEILYATGFKAQALEVRDNASCASAGLYHQLFLTMTDEAFFAECSKDTYNDLAEIFCATYAGGETFAHVAARDKKHKAKLEFLANKYNIPLTQPNEKGQKPYDIAASRGTRQLIRELIKAQNKRQQDARLSVPPSVLHSNAVSPRDSETVFEAELSRMPTLGNETLRGELKEQKSAQLLLKS